MVNLAWIEEVEQNKDPDRVPAHSKGFVNECVGDLLVQIPYKSIHTYQYFHLQADIDDLFTSQITDQDRLQLQLESTNAYVKYPFEPELKNSTVYHFSNDLSKFSPMFLDLLHSVYQGTSNESNTVHYRINLVKSNGNIHALEFLSQENYWNCIRCIILIYRKIAIHDFTCKCKVTNMSSSDSGKQKAAGNSSSSYSSYFNKSSDNIEDCYCEIKGSMVTVRLLSAGQDQELFSTDVLALSAITLSADSQPVKPYIWQVACSLSDPPTEELLNVMSEVAYKIAVGAGASNNPILNAAPIKDPIMIPVSVEEAAKGEYKEGPLSILFSGPKLVPMVSPSLYYNPSIKFEPFVATPTNRISSMRGSAVDEVRNSSVITLPVVSYVKALRLVIKRAAEIYYPSKDNSLPSPYCSCYLLDKDENKMTKNSIEHRTAAAASTVDPVWDKEMYFVCDPAATCVHVKLRHHKSFFSKEEHIGQVSIPVDCFVEGTEAALCLPLEPTYRMEGQYAYGEIHILTEAVYMDPNDIKTNKQAPVVLRKKPVGTLTISVNTTVRDVDDLFNAWWPCRHFNGEFQGVLLCGVSHLLVKLAVNVILQYKEYSEYRAGGYLCIPWWQIILAVHISDASLIVTFTARPVGSELDPVQVDLLVGPTRAVEMETMIQEQRGVCGFRLLIHNLLSIMTQADNAFLAQKFQQEGVNILSSLENAVVECLKITRKAGDKKVDEKKASPEEAILYSSTQRKYIKAMLYINLLRRRCHMMVLAGHLPDIFSVDAVQELAFKDLNRVDQEASMALDIEVISNRVELITTLAAYSMRKLVLCTVSRIPESQSHIVGELIRVYHAAAVRSVNVYEAPGAGEEVKIGIIKYLIANNSVMAERLEPTLLCLGFKCTTSLALMEETRFHQLTEWYSASLVSSVKFWLSRNIEHANSSKTSLNLPWDFELTGTVAVSPLPETFFIQLNVFFDLCSQVTASRNDTSQRSMKNNQYLILNEKIITAVAQALELLADEYIRALQSKHWADGEDENVERNIGFLESVANDAYRVPVKHCLRIREIHTTTALPSEVIVQRITRSFEGVRSDALKRLARLIFTDLQEYFATFETQWTANNNSILVGTIIATLEDYFNDILPHLEASNFLTFLNICCGICSARYLLFLKERAAKKSAFSAEEVGKVSEDMVKIKKCFKKWIKRTEDAHEADSLDAALLAALEKTLRFLGDAHGLLLLQPIGKLKVAVTALLTAYPRELHQIASAVLKLVTLRPDYGLELINMVAIEEKRFYFPEQKLEDSLLESCESDLFVRVFYKSAEDSPTFKTFVTPGKAKKGGRSVNKLKVIRELAADLAGTTPRAKQVEQSADIERAVGLRENISVSRLSSRSELYNSAADQLIKPEDTCFVIISSIQVRGLVSGSLMGLCNPYIALTIGNIRVKTKVQWNKKQECSWDDDVITIKASKSRLTSLQLRAEVFDKERIRRKKEIGEVSVKLSGLELHSIDSWFALTGANAVKSCEIHLTLNLSGAERF